MKQATSRVTAQGQVSVPAEVRRVLGIEPGATLEWDVEHATAGGVTVRRVGRHTFEDIRRVLFPEGAPKPRSLEELKEGIADRMRERYARR